MKQGTFHYALLQFFDFLTNHAVFRGILDVLEQSSPPELESAAKGIFVAAKSGDSESRTGFMEGYEFRHAAFSYFLIRE
jgi:hypothetical protein